MRFFIFLTFLFHGSILAQTTFQLSGFRGQPVAGSAQRIELGDAKGLVIFFTGTRCPYDELYRNRMEKLAQEFSGEVVFSRVNSMPGEDPAEMARQAGVWKSVVYVVDSAQLMFRKLGAKKTSEVFLLFRRGDAYELFYRGPVDDNPQVESDADRKYLKDAIVNLLQGKPSEGHIDRIPGCLIRALLPEKP